MSHRIRAEAAQLVRFALLGGATSSASIVLYALLQHVWPRGLAYAAAYLFGIGLSALLSGGTVFRVRPHLLMRLRAFLGYGAVFLIGLTLLWVLEEGAGLAPLIACLGSVAVTAPLNYLVGRSTFAQRGAAASTGSRTST